MSEDAPLAPPMMRLWPRRPAADPLAGGGHAWPRGFPLAAAPALVHPLLQLHRRAAGGRRAAAHPPRHRQRAARGGGARVPLLPAVGTCVRAFPSGDRAGRPRGARHPGSRGSLRGFRPPVSRMPVVVGSGAPARGSPPLGHPVVAVCTGGRGAASAGRARATRDRAAAGPRHPHRRARQGARDLAQPPGAPVQGRSWGPRPRPGSARAAPSARATCWRARAWPSRRSRPKSASPMPSISTSSSAASSAARRARSAPGGEPTAEARRALRRSHAIVAASATVATWYGVGTNPG